MPLGMGPRSSAIPWEPRPHAGNIAALGRILGAQGLNKDQIREQIKQVYGDTLKPDGRPYTSQEIGRAATNGARWGERLQEIFSGSADPKIPRQQILRNDRLEVLGIAYRYTVQVEFHNPYTGERRTRTVIVTSENNLSWSEIKKLVADTVSQLAAGSESFENADLENVTAMDLVLAERRT